MRTVIYSDVDGYKIIRGFDSPSVDPKKTEMVVGELVRALPELATLKDAKSKIAELVVIANQATSEKDYNDAASKIAELQASLDGLESAYNSARDALWNNNLKYGTPGPGEDIIEDADFETLSTKYDALPEGSRLTLDGIVIPDNRGKVYWIKGDSWKAVIVSAIGEKIPKAAIWESGLSSSQSKEIASQNEAARISALTDAERLAEAMAAQKSAKAVVVSIQSEVAAGITEQSEMDAAKASYLETLATINVKYGTALV